MTGAIVLIVAITVAAPTPDPGTFLLDQAARARSSGDTRTMLWCLQAWTSLAPRTSPPPGFEAEIDPVFGQWRAAGVLRLFGSRIGEDRVRVGLHDPAHVVDYLAVTVHDGDRVWGLTARESAVAGRLAYAGDGPIPATATVSVEAFINRFGAPVLVRRAIIAPTALAPPPPIALRSVATSSNASTANVDPPALRWWWVATGIVATALAGAAVWQETRFDGRQ